jgi:hypothetical protein
LYSLVALRSWCWQCHEKMGLEWAMPPGMRMVYCHCEDDSSPLYLVAEAIFAW